MAVGAHGGTGRAELVAARHALAAPRRLRQATTQRRSVPLAMPNEPAGGSGQAADRPGGPRDGHAGAADRHADAGRLWVSGSCSIPLDELTWRFSGSGGPGGQHANTANTRVEVRFDIAGSPSLGPRQRARLLDRIGPWIRVVASDERSQARNRALALRRLRDRLAEALRTDRARVATRPTRASRERRLADKRRRGEQKRERTQHRDLPDG